MRSARPARPARSTRRRGLLDWLGLVRRCVLIRICCRPLEGGYVRRCSRHGFTGRAGQLLYICCVARCGNRRFSRGHGCGAAACSDRHRFRLGSAGWMIVGSKRGRTRRRRLCRLRRGLRLRFRNGCDGFRLGGRSGGRSLIALVGRALARRNVWRGGGDFRLADRGGAGGQQSGTRHLIGDELQRCGRRRQARERLVVDAQRREHAEATAQCDHGSRHRGDHQTKVGEHRTPQ